METPGIEEFIARAKRNTYASGEGKEKNPKVEGSVELFYRSGKYSYRDIYFGGKYFNGIETIYLNEKPVWGMVYSGGITGGNAGQVYEFLKKCLYLVDEEAPFRGPKSYNNGEFYYSNQYEGDFDHFIGYENIEMLDDLVYELHYSGGSIIQ